MLLILPDVMKKLQRWELTSTRGTQDSIDDLNNVGCGVAPATLLECMRCPESGRDLPNVSSNLLSVRELAESLQSLAIALPAAFPYTISEQSPSLSPKFLLYVCLDMLSTESLGGGGKHMADGVDKSLIKYNGVGEIHKLLSDAKRSPSAYLISPHSPFDQGRQAQP